MKNGHGPLLEPCLWCCMFSASSPAAADSASGSLANCLLLLKGMRGAAVIAH